MKISNVIVGGMFAITGIVLYISYRSRPDQLRGLTYKQFVWCCAILIVLGAVLAFSGFIF
jgi:hypothetical protein